MTMFNKQGVLMDNWHKCPNILTDKLVGPVISPNAGWVVLTVWRLTDGIRGRAEASIPTEKFMSVLDTDRKNTAYKYIKEAVQSGLISVKKSRGKVSIYSVNKKCDLWYDVEVVAENAPTFHQKEVVAENATSVEKRHMVVAENATTNDQSSGGKRHTYKDIKIKDNNKEIESNAPTTKTTPKKAIKKKTTIDKPDDLSQQIWDDLITLRKTKKAPLTKTAWTPIANQIEEIQKQTGHSLDEIVTVWVTRAWIAIKAEWYFNHIKNNQTQQTSYQGNTNANHQSANSQHQQFDTSTTSGYAAKLDADAAAYYAEQAARAQQSADGSTENAF